MTIVLKERALFGLVLEYQTVILVQSPISVARKLLYLRCAVHSHPRPFFSSPLELFLVSCTKEHTDTRGYRRTIRRTSPNALE